MDPVGFAVGLLSLFGTCMDAMDKFGTFRDFSQESRQLFSIFEADKKRFQEWAREVGISNGKLEDIHNPRLDNPEIANAVK